MYDNEEIEDFIEDWYWDNSSHEFARQMARFLFQFIDYLEGMALSKSTIQKHTSNCWCIGYLSCNYGDFDKFSPNCFLNGPFYLSEFKRKFSDSKYAVGSYKTTWNKLDRYVRSLGYDADDDKE